MKEGLNNNSWFVLPSQEAWGSELLQGFSSAIEFLVHLQCGVISVHKVVST